MYTIGGMKPTNLLICLLLTASSLAAQPEPGDVFREYIWIPDMVNEDGKFLRVGGKLDYTINTDHFPSDRHHQGFILLDDFVDLDLASHAEVLVEKVGSHDDTKGLRISWNKHPFHHFPAADSIPAPESDYMHHTNPVVPVPLEELHLGYQNAFRLEVDKDQRWDWPQNLVYGLVLRIYYHPDSMEKYTRNRLLIDQGDGIQLGLIENDQPIRKVDYLGHYTGVNVKGDGRYRQWQYRFLRGQLRHHLGSAEAYPYTMSWDTRWIPDQSGEMRVAARITHHNGIIFFTPSASVTLPERPYRVILAKPEQTPKNWVTREGDHSVTINIPVPTEQIEEARLYWTSWSPCYNQGLQINSHTTGKIEGPCYEFMDHEILVEPSWLHKGANTFTTLKEPLHDGQMVHGMEVQYPGLTLLIKTVAE